MLRHTCITMASKSSGTNCKYQARPPRKKPKQFLAYIGGPVSTKEPIKEQRSVYTKLYTRIPEYVAGRNTYMNPKTYTISAELPGVMTVESSKINPKYKTIHVEPDIAKINRSRCVRRELKKMNVASNFSKNCSEYLSEMYDHEEPAWRSRVMKEHKNIDRFLDPNLLARGIVPALTPLNMYQYN
eukprot:Tbor_TRINITY_DN3172_c0_g1::TRINITY_DN3172_c0_g1_i2::g.14634::m.14634